MKLHLTAQDILFIGGGNTERMLQIWENKGFTAVLNKLKKADKLPILAGVSAGGMYPFHSGLTDSVPGYYKVMNCLNWLKESFCAHSNSKTKAILSLNNLFLERMPAYKTAIKLGKLPPGYAVPNDCMLHFYNDEFVKALSAQKHHHCFFVTADAVEPVETFHLTKQNTLDEARQVLVSLGFKEENNATLTKPKIMQWLWNLFPLLIR